MSAKRVLLIGTTLLTLMFVSVGIAAAQADAPEIATPAQRDARIYGVIQAVEGQSLTLATPIGPVTVVTDVNTRFRIPDVEESNLDDATARLSSPKSDLAEVFAVGDTLGAAGWWEEEGGTFHAFGVARLETGRAFPLAGKLTEVSDDTLTVETGHGLAIVRVDDETVVRIRGLEEPSLDDSSTARLSSPKSGLAEVLDEGMRIIARGPLNPDGSLQAQTIAVPWVGATPGPAAGPGAGRRRGCLRRPHCPWPALLSAD